MFIEHIDQLRCTGSHEETWLIATFNERSDRFIVTGKLGCYICHQEFPIISGTPYFNVEAIEDGEPSHLITDSNTGNNSYRNCPNSSSNSNHSHSQSHSHSQPESIWQSEDLAMRAAAFLNPAEHSNIVMMGNWAVVAHDIPLIIPSTVFAVNPAGDLQETEKVSVIRSDMRIPLARASVSGVALDSTSASDTVISDALRVLKPKGRLVAPASIPAPTSVRVLAQDENFWVGEKGEELVILRR